MALSMPGPLQHKTGVFFLNVRVPTGLLPRLRGAKVSLPVDDKLVTLSINQKVFMSLRTKQARERFAASYAALVRQWHVGGYYPECNPLIPLWHHAERSKVPAAKSVPVVIKTQTGDVAQPRDCIAAD